MVFLLLVGLIPHAPLAQAGMIRVEVVSSSSTTTVGQQVEVTVKADIEQNLLGFGFDLLFDEALFKETGVTIASPFLALATDGNALAGLAYPENVVGDGITLAVVTLTALAPGQSRITVGVTPGDPTQGFPEYGHAWASLEVAHQATVVVLAAASPPSGGNAEQGTIHSPEPATVAMIALGMALTRRTRRGRRFRAV